MTRRPGAPPAAANLALALVLAALVAAPTASAAAFDVPNGRVVERPLEPGTSQAFAFDVLANQEGFVYAKVLPTPGNVLHDSYVANGSAQEKTGWFVSFAFIDADGARTELGDRVGSEPTELRPVAPGDAFTFEATLHVPDDAASGGPEQRAYVALAYRLDATTSSGGASGASMDSARALTLLLTNDMLPPVPVSEGPGAADGATDPGGAVAPTDSDVPAPPVGEIPQESASGGDTFVTVAPSTLPSWFLAGALFVGALMAVALATVAAALVLVARELRARPALAAAPEPSPHARTIPVLAPRGGGGVLLLTRSDTPREVEERVRAEAGPIVDVHVVTRDEDGALALTQRDIDLLLIHPAATDEARATLATAASKPRPPRVEWLDADATRERVKMLLDAR